MTVPAPFAHATSRPSIAYLLSALELPCTAGVDCWNEFQLALTIIQTNDLQLLPVRIINFMGFQRTDWGPTMAFSVMVAVPAIILFAIVQRNMISGLMSGFSK